MPMRVACTVQVTEEQRTTLARWSRGRSTPARLVQRAKIVLMAAEGKQDKDIAAGLKTSRETVSRWRRRFVQMGTAGLEKDAPRSGRKPTVREAVAHLIIERTTKTRPQNATHWSTRTLAKELGISHLMVHRVWRANGLKPHLARTFKVSNDPHFAEKIQDVVGLYLNPPEHALVFSVDEKSQIQALDRTQPSLPMIPGRCGTMTHDYKRNGTTTLFAALNVLDGQVIGDCMSHHRHQEWLRFLRRIDRETPIELDIHLIVDNYATHKHLKVNQWLERHPRFHVHFTPTSSSWLNLIERWFRDLTDKRIRRGVFRSVSELVQVIEDYISQHNQTPRPFAWTAKAEDILAKIGRAKIALHKTGSV
jgi:transposase